MHANHSAKGLLQSGATAKAAVRIYKSRMGEALRQVLDESAKVIDHRGRSWRRAMGAISDVLTEERNLVSEAVSKSLMLAGVDTGDARLAVNKLLDEVASDLQSVLDEFAKGWTAPIAKRWTERNPVAYAILLLVVGALIAATVQKLWSEPAQMPSSGLIAKAPA